MSRLLACLVLLLAASCAQIPAPPASGATDSAAAPSAAAATALVCRVASNGGPILADRGIGGTGIQPDDEKLSERGIGGTGIALDIPRSVVRGLTEAQPIKTRPTQPTGDAAVVGIITGFGSICIDGAEMGMDGTIPVEIDGSNASGAALRAGQVAVIAATTEDGALRSLRLAVRHAVAGPIEHLDASGATMTIAGQPVVVAPGAWGADQLTAGAWVAVSGLSRPDGTIVATRFDPMSTGWVSVRGQIHNQGGTWHIGSTAVIPPPGMPVEDGSFVTADGPYASGTLRAKELAADGLAQDPRAFFGPGVHRIIERAIVRIEPGKVWLNAAVAVPLAKGVAPAGGDAIDAVLMLDRGPDGAYAVSRVDPAPAPLAR